jgi:hypothetical protein
MDIGVTGLIQLVAQPHVEMLPNNKCDNATIHHRLLEDSHVKEMPHKLLLAHS